MKYKLISLTATVAIPVFMLLLTSLSSQMDARVHQHLQAAGKPDCTSDGQAFCTELPLVSLDLGGKLPPLELLPVNDDYTHMSSYITGSIAVYNDQQANNHLSDAPELSSGVLAKYRGNSSILFNKKSYKISLVAEDGAAENKQPFIDMPKHDEWVLNGPFLDKTLLRNYMCMNIAGEIRDDTPEVRLCELFINGDYQGVYLAMEHIEMSEDRVDLTRYTPGDPYTSYILRVDRNIEESQHLNNFASYALRQPPQTATEIIYPPSLLQTPELRQYIKNDFSAFEKSLYSFDYNSPFYGYEALVDVDSFVDYFIINEFFGNNDAGMFSTYFYKDLRGKLQIGPVWDFNNSCDNYMEVTTPVGGFTMVSRPWYDMMSRDPAFIRQVISRYRQLRGTVLSDRYLMDYIDRTQQFLGDAIDRNYEVWGDSLNPAMVDDSNKLYPDERNPRSYEEAIDQLKGYITARGSWLDSNIELLNQYCHTSRNKKFNH